MANVLNRFGSVSLLLSRNATVRFYSNKVKRSQQKHVSPHKTFGPTNQSLASKGFLRPLKPYDPPENLTNMLSNICAKLGISANPETDISGDAALRFTLLNDCFKEFKHGISNPVLNTIETIGDLLEFYNTPVNLSVPLDRMKSAELPKNLHIQYEYHRFHPETDTMFGGLSAFPKSSTLVTGLKYKKKYPGHTVKRSWP